MDDLEEIDNNRKKKLDKLTERKSKQTAVDGETVLEARSLLEELNTKVKQLQDIKPLNVEKGYDFNSLIEDIKSISTLEAAAEDLARSIREIKIEIPDSISIRDVEKIIDKQEMVAEKISDIKIPESIQVEGLEQLVSLIGKVEIPESIKIEDQPLLEAIKGLRIPDANIEVKFADDKKIDILRDAILSLDKTNLEALGKVVGNLDNLIKAINDNTLKVSQDPSDFIPVRRVRYLGSRLIFDDASWSSSSGGGGSSIQDNLISGNAVKVVNPDGSNIGGGSSSQQYSDGDVVPDPTGNVVMWRNSGDNSINAAADDAPLPTSIESSVQLDTIEDNQTNGSQQTRIMDGSNVANVFLGDSGYNGIVVGRGIKTVAFTTTTVQAVGTTDVANYAWVSVQITSQGTSSAVSWQASNDNTNWLGINLIQSTQGTGSSVASNGSTGMWHGPLPYRYFRLNVTGISAGTTAGTIVFSSEPTGMQSIGVSASQSGTWTVGSNSATGSAVPANAFYMGMNDGTNLIGVRVMPTADTVSNTLAMATGTLTYNGGTYDRMRSVTAATSSLGSGIQAVGILAQFDDASTSTVAEDRFGNLRMTPNRSLMVENRYSYGRATTDTQIKASAGFVHSISIAPITATPTAGLLTVYDSTTESGTVLYSEWIFATTTGHTLVLDTDVSTGIYVGFDATLANVQATVSYR